MKAQILDISGKKIKEITTDLFEEPIREDIIYKVVEAEKIKSSYSPTYRAGMDRSASGLQRKTRHVWKSDRGKGLSRIPRKLCGEGVLNFHGLVQLFLLQKVVEELILQKD